MPSDVLSSNFDLLNIGTSNRRSRSIFTRREASEQLLAASKENQGTRGPLAAITRRRAATKGAASQTEEARAMTAPALALARADASEAPSGQATSGKRLLRTKSANGTRRFPLGGRAQALLEGHGRASSSSALLTIQQQQQASEDAQSYSRPRSPSSRLSIGKKRKRQLPTAQMQTRSGSNGSSTTKTSSMTHRGKAPSSQISLASSVGASPSDSDSSLSSVTSRRASKTSLALGQGFGEMIIDSKSHSPQASPVGRRKASATGLRRAASTRKSSREQQEAAVESDGDDEDIGFIDHPSPGKDRDRHDRAFLAEATSAQLERMHKPALVSLANSVPIDTAGLTKAQIIQALVEMRALASQGSATAHRTSLVRNKSSAGSSRKASGAPVSARSNSADYTDESEDELRRGVNYERGNEGGGEETEAEPTVYDVVKRRRRPGRQAPAVTNRQKSPMRRGGRQTGQPVFVDLAGGRDGSKGRDQALVPSPIVNRLRKQRSLLHFASPVRGRNRARLDRRQPLAAPVREYSPLKPQPRRTRSKALPEDPANPAQTSEDVDMVDEDWVDDVVFAVGPSRRNAGGRQRRAKLHAKKALAEQSDSEMDVAGSEGPATDEENDEAASQASGRSLEERAITPQGGAHSAADDGDAESEVDDSEDADETATQVSVPRDAEDEYVDSDATDTPDGPGRRNGRQASPASPLKIRRLRNGKLRVSSSTLNEASPPPASAVDAEQQVESQLASQPLIRTGGHQLRRSKGSRNTSGSTARATQDEIKANLATPKLGSSNDAAKTAEGEQVDELNGLDLEGLNLTDKEIPARQLSKTSKIGSGGFKDVFVGIWKVGKRRNKVAIADIREKLTEMDIKELSLLRDLKHENIVRFIGVSVPEDTARSGIPCMIVSELCSNGDLWDYIRTVKPPSTLDVFRMLLETARGLEYLHMHSIVHRDVKSSNVLVTKTRACKINDFGLARVKKSQRSKMHSVVGTVNWQASELWCAMPQYNEKVDVWSTAMTFWEVLQWHEDYQSYPFEGMNEFMIYEEVGKKGMRPRLDHIVERYGEGIAKLLSRMWEADPRKRPTMDMVCADLEHLIETTKMELGI
ncbi:unnamed protein product [Parajaminaea phylloscopi]